jgi:hypothetical protein
VWRSGILGFCIRGFRVRHPNLLRGEALGIAFRKEILLGVRKTLALVD